MNRTSRFYHLYISPKNEVDLAEVARTLASCTDCFQYDNHNFVIYTMFDAREWYARLQKYVEPGGKMFICELDITDYWGFMNNGLWKMLKRVKEGQTSGRIGEPSPSRKEN
ncbi:MAG: hypothetical protein HY037_05485 [Nitrospirae bacterium]|nr:hypothetical protein [Candidatus Troglogloeales bacterium]